MDDLTPEEALRTLTQTEAYILYWVCDDLPYKQIARYKVPVGINMVTIHMSNVYSKLGISASMHATQRRKILEETFCPILKKLCRDNPENIKKEWPIDDPNPQPNPKTFAIVVYEQGRQDAAEEIKNELLKRERGDIIDPLKKYPPPPPKKPWGWIFIAVASFLLMIVFAAFSIVNMLHYEKLLAAIAQAPTQVPPSTIAVTQEVTREIVREITKVVEVIQPTNTPYPTYTIIPSPTKIPVTPTPSFQLPFSDNFDNGIDPHWQNTVGNWMTANGRLVPVSGQDWNWISLNAPDWTNYKIKVNIQILNIGSAAQTSGNIAVRVLNSNPEMIAFCTLDIDRPSWSLTDGRSDCQPIAGYGKIDKSSNFNLEVDVIGNEFIAYVDGKETQRMTYPGYEKGEISLGSQCKYNDCTSFDNFSIEALP